MKHSYRPDCPCPRCTREGRRRSADRDRQTPQVMLDWTASRHRRRARIAREYWDAYESGRPMSADDY